MLPLSNVFFEHNLRGLEIIVIKFIFHFFVSYHIAVYTSYPVAVHVLSQILNTIFFPKVTSAVTIVFNIVTGNVQSTDLEGYFIGSPSG